MKSKASKQTKLKQRQPENSCRRMPKNEWLLSSLVFLMVLIVYIKCLHPSLPGGDSGELVVAAYEFGVAHPPGYPLFTILAKAFMVVLPLGSVVWRVNLLSAVCGAAAASILFLLVFRLTSSYGASVFASGMFAFSSLVWTWSVCAEVFSLNNLLVALLLLTVIHFDAQPKNETICLWGAALCGLCLTNQHTSVVYVAVIVFWVFGHLYTQKFLSVQLLLKLSLAFAIGLTPYVYLPLSSTLHLARWTWGDQRSLFGFLRHLFRAEYGTWDLLKNHTGRGAVSGLEAYTRHLVTSFGLPFFTLFLLSLVSIYLRRKNSEGKLLSIFHILFLIYLGFFSWRANLDISQPLFFRVVERFWMQSDLVVVVLASVAFSDVCRYIHKLLNLHRASFDLLLAVPFLAIHLHWHWAVSDHSHNLVVHNFALQSLNSFPNGSLVLTKGDLPSNSFRYFHLCENVRPDLDLFDQEVLTYAWSLPRMRIFHPRIQFPGDVMQLYSGPTPENLTAFTFRRLLDANFEQRPILACIGVQDHEPSWEAAYDLLPLGVCWQFIKKGIPLDVDNWTKQTSNVADQWLDPWSNKSDGSWEQIANEEMWRARTATALFYLEQSSSSPEGSKEWTHLLMHSYQLYTKAIESYSPVPAFWHRNYAITCERLTRAKTSLKLLDLVEKTVFHFREFLHLSPSDPDSPKIQRAINTLQHYLDEIKNQS